jgi:hypothetical protein
VAASVAARIRDPKKEEKKERVMNSKPISRRRFLEASIKGGAVVGIETRFGPLRGMLSGGEIGPDGLTLKVIGDSKQGYSVDLLFKGRPIARHNRGAEFSARFQNEDRSVEDRVENWRATSWSGDATHIVLDGECILKNLNATAFTQVEYEIVTPSVVRKRIRFQQSDMLMMFYQVSNRLEPLENPAKFWSFDQVDWKGGPAHEYFPAAGFRTNDGVCVGLLTDSGYRNQWTRLVRRDGGPVKPAPSRIPDANLYSGSNTEERRRGDFFVQQTFGEILEQQIPEQEIIGQKNGSQSARTIDLTPMSSWKNKGKAGLIQHDDVAIISAKSSDDGVVIPFAAKACDVFSVRVEYRSSSPVAIEVWDVDVQSGKLAEITLYNDNAPGLADVWSEFRTTVFIPGLQGNGCAVFLSVAPSEQSLKVDASSGSTKFEVRGLQIHRIATRTSPYHRLEMGQSAEKTVFVFAGEKVPDTLRGHRLASQLYLADGLGFRGGETEKVVYSDVMMLSWIAGPESFRPILAPSIWYSAAGEMYLRDSFFALNGTHNRELNESVFNLWAENQGSDGAINTLVEPNLANVERKSNDSTPLWLMWALRNRQRFGTLLPEKKIRKAAEYCIATYDPRREGICTAQFVMGQLDVIRYPEGTSEICENQGILAVTARVIKELGIEGASQTISEEYVSSSEELYRSYYNSERKFMRPARNISDAIGFAEIFPEFLSLWLFGRKILTDEMVVSHLDRIPTMMPRKDCPHPEISGTVRPILIGLPAEGNGWKYFTEKWHPMISDSFATSYANHGMDGIYYNGSSWMRIEICGYVAGKLHGWSGATKAIENRLWAEINIAPDFPTSQEYLATDPAHPFFGYHRVFAWNSFVLQALELAGMRSSKMDPDFSK